MATEKQEETRPRCATCRYFTSTEEYWHDHYLIQSHTYCSYRSRCNEVEVKADDVCKDYKPD